MIAPQVATRIGELPNRPGIYVFRAAGGDVLYVGKAKSLRKRAATYLKGGQEARLAVMLQEAADLEFVVTDSEAEALLLENNWIKCTKPRYNILLRDDKTYPYLYLTGDEYPRLGFTRRIGGRNTEYFGPYLPAGVARKAIKLVQKLFQVRVCTIPIDGRLPRPCLYYDMKRCLGPCVDGLTTREEYAKATAEARLFLQGRSQELVAGLKRRMRAAADELEYEEAARVRDLIGEIEAASQRRKLSSVRGDDVDIFGIQVTGGRAAVAVLVMRGGQVLDRREFFWESETELAAETVLSELLPQVYDRTTFIPREIHLPVPVEGAEALTEWLSQRRGGRVYLRLPARGPKADRVALAERNAKLAYGRRFRERSLERAGEEGVRELLELDEAPRRIEGFDISNLQGAKTVASLVVWEEGRMRKADYRSFNIKGVSGPDDTASLEEAVFRRYRRRLDEVGEMPDVILIDGGRGQLNAAVKALSSLGVEETPVLALAKREEEIYRVDLPEPLRPPRTHAGLRLLQEIRDEAHRFAVDRHRRRRRRSLLKSRLEEVPGVGPKRRRELLRRFGSLAGVREASLEKLVEVLGPMLGERVFRALAAPDPD